MTNIGTVDSDSNNNESIIFAVNKPVGISSFDVIRFIKKKFKLSRKIKIGHFGTLDPFAQGVLLVGLGKSLRLTPYVHLACQKTYRALGVIGLKTDSGDYLGENITANHMPDNLLWQNRILEMGQSELQSAAQKLVGKYLQGRPYFSAAKVNGRSLYEYAREGEFIDVEKIERFVSQFDILDCKRAVLATAADFFSPKYPSVYNSKLIQTTQMTKQCSDSYPMQAMMPVVCLRAVVSSGTYIRTLFEDYCQILGGVGHLLALHREAIGETLDTQAIKLEQLDCFSDIKELNSYSIDPKKLLPYSQIMISPEQARRLRHGQRLKSIELAEDWGPYSWAILPTDVGLNSDLLVGLLENKQGSASLVLHWS